MLKLKPHQRRKRHSRALEVLILRHPPLPLIVARRTDPERHPIVAGPLAESDVQVHVVADGVEDVGGEGGRPRLTPGLHFFAGRRGRRARASGCAGAAALLITNPASQRWRGEP